MIFAISGYLSPNCMKDSCQTLCQGQISQGQEDGREHIAHPEADLGQVQHIQADAQNDAATHGAHLGDDGVGQQGRDPRGEERDRTLIHQHGNGGKSERTNTHKFNWQLDNILRWKKDFGYNHFELTLLQNLEQNQSWSTTATNKQYTPSDVLSYHALKAGSDPTVDSDDTYDTGDALMARLFYEYKNKFEDMTVPAYLDGKDGVQDKFFSPAARMPI